MTARSHDPTTMELEDDRTIVITRSFDAPARIVFDAWTKPELVRRWWAPKSLGVTMVSCDADVRVGGTYRYAFRPRDGKEAAFSGTYQEVTPHSRLVYTTVFEPAAAMGEAIVIATFDEHDGRTRLVLRERYPSPQVRDGVIASGMEKGMRESMEQLEDAIRALA